MSTQTDVKQAKKRAFQSRTIGPSTINNPTEHDYEKCRTAVSNNILRYVTFNLEVGESGTPHLQIHAQSKEKLTATAWQKALGGRVGNIVATKSPQYCIDYCQGYTVKSDRTERKEGSQDIELPSITGHLGYEEYGSNLVQGSRTDLTKCIDQIKAGATIRDLIETNPGTVNGAYRMLTEYKRETLLLTAKQLFLNSTSVVIGHKSMFKISPERSVRNVI